MTIYNDSFIHRNLKKTFVLLGAGLEAIVQNGGLLGGDLLEGAHVQIAHGLGRSEHLLIELVYHFQDFVLHDSVSEVVLNNFVQRNNVAMHNIGLIPHLSSPGEKKICAAQHNHHILLFYKVKTNATADPRKTPTGSYEANEMPWLPP